MENIKNILIQTPVFNAVIANLKDHEDIIKFSIAVGMLDHLYLISDYTLQLCILTKHTESLSHNILDKLDENKWKIISGNIPCFLDCPLSDNFIRRYSDKIDWKIFSVAYELTFTQLEEFADKIDWKAMSKLRDLNPNFIEAFQEKLDWRCVSKYSELTEDFIERFDSKVDWEKISQYQMLSKIFILKFSEKIDFYALLRSENRPDNSFLYELLKNNQ